MEAKNYKLSADSRTLIAGKTGSGKTYLARHMLAHVKRLIVIDSKATLTDWHTVDLNRDSLDLLDSGEDVRIRVTREENYLTIVDRAYKARDVFVYIDEVYAVVPPGKNPPPEVTAVWTRGREFGVGAVASTQRPTWVPLVLLSEAENYFVFRLNMDEDRKRMASMTDAKILEPIRDHYGFWYYNTDSSQPIYVRQYKGD